MPFLGSWMRPMLDYFQYEQVLECSDDDLRQSVKNGKKFILAFQPHGVISFCSFCAWANSPTDLRSIPTAVASVLLNIPILKHVLGIFCLTSASGENVKRILRKGNGLQGCLVLYVGGIAELFKSSRKEERLYVKSRKGFIKVALREGVDIIPAYLFGNTAVLTVWKNRVMANLSRKMQMSLTYYWGTLYLPIPRDEKLLYARGKPLGLPHLPEPTDDDVDKWHAKYCEEVLRLFDTYKGRLPSYEHKTLSFD